MKICYLIAEYNPFHLGHLKHIDYIKQNLNPDKIVVIMSGNFTQRGEISVLDKFTRAKHAILAGADMVIELPTVFATANAETFARGAIKIISSLNTPGQLCFGVESGAKEDYVSLATALLDESKEFKKTLKGYLSDGVSLAKAKYLTVRDLGAQFNEQLISSPNNILGVEYVKAILSLKATLEICPMIREGNHNDETLYKGITSASSIRNVLKQNQKKKVKKCLPNFVYKDLVEYHYVFEKIIMGKLFTTSCKQLALAPDCTEGLENRIKALSKDNPSLDDLIEKATTKRYTSTRIKRIILNNFLCVTDLLVKDCLNAELYAKVLAVNSNGKDLISTLSSNSSIPIVTRKSDLSLLGDTANKCYEIDTMANDVYNLISGKKINENQMLII